MTATAPSPARLQAEVTYEVGMMLAASFYVAVLLTQAEFEAFQGELADRTAPLTGGLDEGVNDWINAAR